MAPVTEIAYITLKPGVELTGSSPSAQAWSDALSAISAQEGYQRQHWGVSLEDPSLLMLLIDWDGVESHQKFINDPSYGPFKETLGQIMLGVHLFHITPTPFPPAILSAAPVIEFCVFYLPFASFLTDIGKFVRILDEKRGEGKVEGYYGASYGESVEGDVVKHSEQGEEGASEKGGKAVAGFLGWGSKEAHLAFRETELFKENIGLLRGNNRGAEVFHVKFTAV